MEQIKEQAKRRVSLRIVALIVGMTVFSLSVTGGLIAMLASYKENRIRLENSYERSFYELTDASSNLELNLSKMLASGSDGQSAVLAMEVYKNAEAAMDAMTRLPLEHMDVAEAEKFYNQVGDFSLSFNKSLSYKRDAGSYRERLEDLYIAAREINQMIVKESEMLRNNNYNFNAMIKRKERENRANEAKDDGGDDPKNYATIEYPELIYDGPFSDSASSKCYKALESLPEISYEEAVQKLKDTLPYEVLGVEKLGEGLGAAPAYQINVKTPAGDVFCDMSKKGGMFLNVNLYRAVSARNLGEDSAKAAAQGYAKKFGFDVEPIWYNEFDDTAVINFAPVKDDIVYYTDLVKVKVALDDGSLLGLETNGYCMNNCERTHGERITQDEAAAKIPSNLTLNNVRLCVIPDGSEKEVLAYELAAEYKGLDYFIYLNAQNGEEVNILRVIDGEQGKQTL